jgi:hydrogenase-4 transcriptional activator
MEKFQPILLKIWQQACKHILLDEMLTTVAPMLQEEFPLGQMLIRRIDSANSCIETMALGFADAHAMLSSGRTICTPSQLKDLLVWWRSGESELFTATTALPRALQPVAEAQAGLDCMLAPIGDPEARQAVLVMIAEPGIKFQQRHLNLCNLLREPFTVAMENDSRLHELEALREAAEADRRSLMERLNRREPGDTIIGAESGLRLVFERVHMVAPLDVPVLILGDTGSGKEIIARAIHVRSNRSRGAFIRVNCGAIPSGLIDSQLFGHEKGAFTGATETRKGWFERADGGTLFLDEVGELPLEAQVRLLRILQDGWLERVGGQKPIHVNVRIVAATHRELAQDVTRKAFREDLWYRLAVFPIRLPALRERPEDIPALARHFAQLAAQQFGLKPSVPSPDDIRLLSSYQWPGNVRELASVIDRAAILGGGSCLKITSALGIMDSQHNGTAEGGIDSTPARAVNSPGNKTIDDIQREHITATLAAVHGRVDGPHGAAVRLGIHPSTLRAKMRKLNIHWREYRLHAR